MKVFINNSLSLSIKKKTTFADSTDIPVDIWIVHKARKKGSCLVSMR